MCWCACMWTCECVYLYASIWRLEINVLCLYLLFLFFDTSVLLNLALIELGYLASKPKDPFVSSSPAQGLQTHDTASTFIGGCWRSELWFSCLLYKSLIHWASFFSLCLSQSLSVSVSLSLCLCLSLSLSHTHTVCLGGKEEGRERGRERQRDRERN